MNRIEFDARRLTDARFSAYAVIASGPLNAYIFGKHMKKIVRLGLLFYVLWAALTVHAANILYLSPNEGPVGGADWDNAAYLSTVAASAADSVVDGRGWLSRTTALDTSFFDGIELVVITTTFGSINPIQIPVLKNIIKNRNDIAVVVFADGCCQPNSNLVPIVDIVSEGTGWNLVATNQIDRLINSSLNENSPYQEDFASINPLIGTYYRLITGVPSDYVLFRGDAGVPETSAFGLFVPHAQMNAGNGACVFLTADVSPLGPDADTDGTQAPKVMAAFLKAALDSDGACAKPAAGIPDLAVALTGPAAPTQGTPTAYRVAVRNVGPVAAEATSLSVTLPAGFTLQADSLPVACTASDTQSFSCSVSALAAVDSGDVSGAEFDFQLVAGAGANPGAMLVTVLAPLSEVNLANNTANLALSVTAAPIIIPPEELPPEELPPASALTPVPVLGLGGLAMLSALVAGLGLARGRKASR